MGIATVSFVGNLVRFKMVETSPTKLGYKGETIPKTKEGVTIQNQTATIISINALSFSLSGIAFLLHARGASQKLPMAISLISTTFSLLANIGINFVKYRSVQIKWQDDVKLNSEYYTMINNTSSAICDRFNQAVNSFNKWNNNKDQAMPLEWSSNQMQSNSDLNAFKYFLDQILIEQPIMLPFTSTVNIRFIIDDNNKLVCYDLSNHDVRYYADLNQDIVSNINQKNLIANNPIPDSLKNIALNLKF